jgi:class 3 adenylate cyclase
MTTSDAEIGSGTGRRPDLRAAASGRDLSAALLRAGSGGCRLQTQGLPQYGPVFVAADLDPSVLPDLIEADLERLGVTLGHRKKLLRAIPPGPRAAKAPPAQAAAAAWEAERRQITEMFCDLVWLTALSARLDPADLREVIGGYRRCVAEAARRFDGFVAKYMGDGVLVYFGYPCRARGRRQARGARWTRPDRCRARCWGAGATDGTSRLATGLAVVDTVRSRKRPSRARYEAELARHPVRGMA